VSTLRKSARICWRVPGMEDAVLFNCAYNHEFIPHSHDAITLLTVTAGAVELDIGHKKYIARAGDMSVVGAHQIHHSRPLTSDGWRMRSMQIPSALLAEMLGRPCRDIERTHFSRPVQVDPKTSSSFLDLHHCAEDQSISSRDLRSFVNDLYRNIDIYGPTYWDACSSDNRIEAAQRLLIDPDKNTMEVNEIAEELGISIFVLIRRFKNIFGLPPCAWRMQARANEAARLLRERRQPAEAAIISGFSDQPHMSRTFKKVFGITPGQYSMMHAEALA